MTFAPLPICRHCWRVLRAGRCAHCARLAPGAFGALPADYREHARTGAAYARLARLDAEHRREHASTARYHLHRARALRVLA